VNKHLECQHIANEGEVPYATLPFLVGGKTVRVCMLCWEALRAQAFHETIRDGIRYAAREGNLKLRLR